jgi:hypothetical protein
MISWAQGAMSPVSLLRQAPRTAPASETSPTAQSMMPTPPARSLMAQNSAWLRVAQVAASSDAARRPFTGSYGTLMTRPSRFSCFQPAQIGRPASSASVRDAMARYLETAAFGPSRRRNLHGPRRVAVMVLRRGFPRTFSCRPQHEELAARSGRWGVLIARSASASPRSRRA